MNAAVRAGSVVAVVMPLRMPTMVFHGTVLPSLVAVPKLMPSHSSFSAPKYCSPNDESGRSTTL